MKLSESSDIQAGIAGGIIIGLSSTFFMYSTGRISGTSGLMEHGLLNRDVSSLSYLAGLVTSGLLLNNSDNMTTVTASIPVVLTSGLLIGFGTRIAGGCTSGHGVCGLPRFSLRSLVGVCTFMGSGAISALLTRDLKEIVQKGPHFSNLNEAMVFAAPTIAAASLFTSLSNGKWVHKAGPLELLMTYISGATFGLGLIVSGMSSSTKVLGFLDFSNRTLGWDYSLMGVMGGAVLLNIFTFSYLGSTKNNVCSLVDGDRKLSTSIHMGAHANNMRLNAGLFVGSAMFGIGWGLIGVCPGPAIVSFAQGRLSPYFIPAIITGMFLSSKVSK